MSRMTLTSKTPVRNTQHPTSHMLSQPNHVLSWLNFQDRPLATTNISFDVQIDPIPQLSSKELSTSSKPSCNIKTIPKPVFSWSEPVFSSIKTCSKPFFSWVKLVCILVAVWWPQKVQIPSLCSVKLTSRVISWRKNVSLSLPYKILLFIPLVHWARLWKPVFHSAKSTQNLSKL